MAITPNSMNSHCYFMSQKTPPNVTVNGNHVRFDSERPNELRLQAPQEQDI